jgi:hypothetical protein
MVDETEFRATLDDLDTLPCPFKKAIFSTVCACEKSERIYIGDREVMACADPVAQGRCNELAGRLREAARFALRVSEATTGLPHGKQIRVETGGLLGLQQVIQPAADEPDRVANVHALVTLALVEFGDLTQLPYPEIIREVARFHPRRRRGRRRT